MCRLAVTVPGHIGRRVDFTQTIAIVEQLHHGRVDGGLSDETLLVSLAQTLVDRSALEVRTRNHRVRARMRVRRMSVVGPVGDKVAYGPAVRHYYVFIAPLAAQYLLQQFLARAARLTLISVVGTDHLRHILVDKSLEGRQISLPQVARVYILGVKRVAVPLGPAVHCKVLGSGQSLHILASARALQPVDHGHTHARSQIRVLAISLLAASPARVAEDVDIGGPERQALITIDMAALSEAVEFRAGLVADYIECLADGRVVKRRSHADGLREHSRKPRSGNTVQSLAPPVELRDTQPRDSR